MIDNFPLIALLDLQEERETWWTFQSLRLVGVLTR
jgi:hypothetical protein